MIQKKYFNSGPKTNALLANLDYATYLPDCLMVKTDRASMKFGLELRSPFLDHNLLELYRGAGDQIVSSLPEKKVLKQILADFLPEHLINRPKMGFSPPIGNWLQGPLMEWSRKTSSGSLLVEIGMVSRFDLDRKLKALSLGDHSNQYQIWNLLTFEKLGFKK